MDFSTLHMLIPHALGEKLHVLTMSPYNGITLALPGRHQKDTPVPGGDFVVMVDDTELEWVKHQFTHDDIFNDVQRKTDADVSLTRNLMESYAKVVYGESPVEEFWTRRWELPGIHPQTFLYAVQCLAVAEHRRYAKHESKGGGRFLPARFAAGIVDGIWTAQEVKKVQRRGRMGLDMLMSMKGEPTKLKELADAR